MRINLSYDHVRSLFVSHGYPFDEHSIQPFGIRSKDLSADKWNDTLGIVCPDRSVIAFSGTTDPGKSPLMKTEGVNAKGIFILMPGYYKNCWQKGMHNGKYKALVQFGFGNFRGWRDNDKNGELNPVGKIYTDVTGLNFHTTRWDKQVQRVGDFSQGCQVVEVAREYDQIIDRIFNSTQSLFPYALFY
jgi:hypothetical protein